MNVENLNYEPSIRNNSITIGTTKGNLILINESTGEINLNISNDSCINDIKWEPDSNRLFTCQDNGIITAYFLEDN